MGSGHHSSLWLWLQQSSDLNREHWQDLCCVEARRHVVRRKRSEWSSVVVCGRISIGEKCQIKTMEDIKNYTKLLWFSDEKKYTSEARGLLKKCRGSWTWRKPNDRKQLWTINGFFLLRLHFLSKPTYIVSLCCVVTSRDRNRLLSICFDLLEPHSLEHSHESQVIFLDSNKYPACCLLDSLMLHAG